MMFGPQRPGNIFPERRGKNKLKEKKKKRTGPDSNFELVL